MILATSGGVEERVIFDDADFDIGGTNDFQISLSYSTWKDDLEIGKKIYFPDTEYGGIIKNITSATNTGEIKLKGYTWRGYLDRRFICPPAGEDYYIASGELNSILRDLIKIPGFTVPNISTGISTTYQFNRYCSVLSGITAMLENVGFRLDIKYINGMVICQAVRRINYGQEFSQDSAIDFQSANNQMGINHLICLGSGELKNRTVIHLYADKNGNVSQTQTIKGVDEMAAIYDNPGADAQALLDGGTARLKELLSSKSFTAQISDIEADLNVGDAVTGRDYITGNVVTETITEKIVKVTKGLLTISYKNDTTSIPYPNTGGSSGGGATLDTIYPVGSIYMSISSTNPSTLIGGTWEQIKDRFLLAAGTTYSGGDTGGEATHKLVETELPSVTGSFDIRHWGPGDMIGNCSGKFSSSSSGGGNMTGTTPNTRTDPGQRITYKFGSGGAHNNMPPYLVVYVWKRTA